MSRILIGRIAFWTTAIVIALFPVKYLTWQIGGADVTAFRLALAAAAGVAGALVLTDSRARGTLFAALRTRTALAGAVLVVWLLVSGAHGFLAAPNDAFERRALLATVGWLIPLVALPLVLLPLLGRLETPWGPAVVAVRFFQALLVYAFFQVALHALDVPVNGISVGEEPVYPVAELFDVLVLRPYSLFGEPRDLASLVIPLLLAGALVARERRLDVGQALVFGALGVLLASFTFYAVLGAFGLYYLLFERRTRIITARAALVAIVCIAGVTLLAPLVGGESRVIVEGGNIVRGDEGDDGEPIERDPSERPTSAAFNQAPDLLAADYTVDVLQGDVGPGRLLVGQGLGSFTRAVNPYYVRDFGWDLVEHGEIVSSRLLPFGLLVEAGAIGLALFAWLIFEALAALHRAALAAPMRSRLRVLAVALVLASVVQTSVAFAVAVLVCLVASMWARVGRAAAAT